MAENDIVERLREAFQRKRYGGDGGYDPDFDLFDVAADLITHLRARAPEGYDEAEEHNRFQDWAANEWTNSNPPHTAWIGWKGRAMLAARPRYEP